MHPTAYDPGELGDHPEDVMPELAWSCDFGEKSSAIAFAPHHGIVLKAD